MKNMGFTLIELLVVITVIGILMAGLVTGILWVVDYSREMKTKAVLEVLMAGVKEYQERTGNYPDPISVGYNPFKIFYSYDDVNNKVEQVPIYRIIGYGPGGPMYRDPVEPINLEIREDSLGKDETSNEMSILDAWGRAIRYYWDSTGSGGRTIYLTSRGVNGREDNPSDKANYDDLVKAMFVYVYEKK